MELPTTSSNVIILRVMQNSIFLWLVSESSGAPLSVWNLIEQAGWVVRFVMLLLAAASIVSWTIILGKFWELRAAKRANQEFSDAVWAAGSLETAKSLAKNYPQAPLTRVFDAGLQEFSKVSDLKLPREQAVEIFESNLGRSLEKSINVEASAMTKSLQFLATTASASPYIGLFGTVWGIMTSFINITATGSSTLKAVAPGIAEALIATAIGLFAAIPATVSYNFFASNVKRMSDSMRHFAAEFMNTAKRSL